MKSEMKEEWSRKIAEWLGKHWHIEDCEIYDVIGGRTYYRCKRCNEAYYPEDNPNYASSLDLMHEAEMELRQKDIKLFYRYVEKLAIYQSGSYQINMVLAPAEVRAQAFVKTIEEAHERKEGL